MGGHRPIEHRWEIHGQPGLWTAKHVQEIPPERASESCARDSDWCDGQICRDLGIDCPNADLSDTMAPFEELSSFLGVVVPWTLSAWTRRGLERKIARFERRHGFIGERVVIHR